MNSPTLLELSLVATKKQMDNMELIKQMTPKNDNPYRNWPKILVLNTTPTPPITFIVWRTQEELEAFEKQRHSQY